jgi:CheY-like chemotaxis protein
MARLARVSVLPLDQSWGLGAVERPLLLWIDDFVAGLALYRAMFENLGFRVLTASRGSEGLELAAAHRPDIIVTDYEMPGMDGEAVALAVKTMSPATPVVMFSGSTLVPSRVRHTVDAVCDKAGSRDQLIGVIHHLLRKKRSSSLQPPPVAPASDVGHRTVA